MICIHGYDIVCQQNEIMDDMISLSLLPRYPNHSQRSAVHLLSRQVEVDEESETEGEELPRGAVETRIRGDKGDGQRRIKHRA